MNRTGIYKIINEETGDFYIGSTRIAFKNRYRSHLNRLRRNVHNNPHLQRAYNLYGQESFYFVIIDVLEGDEEILDREQYYIDTLNPEYNCCRNVRQPNLGRKMSQEQIELLRKSRLGIPAWNKGIPFSEEVRKKMSLSKKGKPAPNKGIKRPSIRQVIRNDNIVYNNIEDAALDLNVKPNTIIKSITDFKVFRYVKGFRFQYLDSLELGFGINKNDLTKHVQVNLDKFIVRYTDINGNKIYKGRFNTLEEALKIRDELLVLFPAQKRGGRK